MNAPAPTTATGSSLSSLKQRLNLFPDRSTVNLKWIAAHLLRLAENPEPDQLHRLLAKLAEPKPKIPTVYAADMEIDRVCTLFRLQYDELQVQEYPWRLTSQPYTPPGSLERRIKDLWAARYDRNCEATCHIAVDFVIIACILQLRSLYPDHFDQKPTPSYKPNTRPRTPESTPGLLTVFPELEISTTITDPRTGSPIRIAGRADWAFGYNTRTTDSPDGSFVVAIEAKKRTALDSALPQLLAYLAMMRDHRLAAGKVNPVVQGFYTDGLQYVFMAIENDATVRISDPLKVLNREHRRTIFNFIVTILETAMKSTPSATPTKPTELAEAEVSGFATLWGKSYDLSKSPVLLPADEDTLEYDDMDLSGGEIAAIR